MFTVEPRRVDEHSLIWADQPEVMRRAHEACERAPKAASGVRGGRASGNRGCVLDVQVNDGSNEEEFMKATFAAATAVAVAALAVAAPPTGAGTRLPPAARAGQMVFYGHIRSLTPSGGRYVLGFDPAWLLEGTTAEKAAVADGVLAPGAPAPNDNYTRDESHKLLMFVVARTARVTVLTRGIHSTPVTVAEFAQLLKGRNPRHRPLFGSPRGWGYWALVDVDRVRSLDAQYHP
jgi:hypothetical protein